MRGWDLKTEDTHRYNQTIFAHLTQLHGDIVKEEYDDIWE